MNRVILKRMLFGSTYGSWDDYKRDWQQNPRRAFGETARTIFLWLVVLVFGGAISAFLFGSRAPTTDNRGSKGGVYTEGNVNAPVTTTYTELPSPVVSKEFKILSHETAPGVYEADFHIVISNYPNEEASMVDLRDLLSYIPIRNTANCTLHGDTARPSYRLGSYGVIISFDMTCVSHTPISKLEDVFIR